MNGQFQIKSNIKTGNMGVLLVLKSCESVGHLEKLTAVMFEPSRSISFCDIESQTPHNLVKVITHVTLENTIYSYGL